MTDKTPDPCGSDSSTEFGAWQPIETAPKDGTEVLVWFDCASVPVVHLAWYRSEAEWHESGQYCGGWDSLEEWVGWWSYTRNSVSQEKLDGFLAPTHWMPYKAPNTEAQRAAVGGPTGAQSSATSTGERI